LSYCSTVALYNCHWVETRLQLKPLIIIRRNLWQWRNSRKQAGLRKGLELGTSQKWRRNASHYGEMCTVNRKKSGGSGYACLKLLFSYSYGFSVVSLKTPIRISRRHRRESKLIGYCQAHCRWFSRPFACKISLCLPAVSIRILPSSGSSHRYLQKLVLRYWRVPRI
jgi:hypothetical protein